MQNSTPFHAHADNVRQMLRALADPVRAQGQCRFFKMGKGQYAEGDVFWGLRVPAVRAIAREQHSLSLEMVECLLGDPVHEVRLCGLLVLVEQFKKADTVQRDAIMSLYLRRADRVNNWDLVDISAALLGQWLQGGDRSLLHRMAHSPTMWEQRMAVVATHVYIRQGDFADILELCRTLMYHKHDLMHKAMGWMLREVGKQDKVVLESFLSEQAPVMPRTMLRYAIERFSEDQRQAWLRVPRATARVPCKGPVMCHIL